MDLSTFDPPLKSEGPDRTSALCPRCRKRFVPVATPGDRAAPCPHCGNVLWVGLESSEGRYAECTSCGEVISNHALVCRYCHESQGSPLPAADRGGLLRWLRWRRKESPKFSLVPLHKVVSNPYQPREQVDVGTPEFEGLKRSISSYGVLVPIIVATRDRKYVLVAGQRRLECCRQLGLGRIPAIIRHLTLLQIIEISYLENLHRRGLSTVEMATGFERLSHELPHVSRSELARRLGRSLNAVNKDMEVAALPTIVREALKRGLLLQEHAMVIKHIRNESHLLEIIKRVHLCRLTPEDTVRVARLYS